MKPNTSIERTCQGCGASFLGLAYGKTGLRGLWKDTVWYCSVACHPDLETCPDCSGVARRAS